MHPRFGLFSLYLGCSTPRSGCFISFSPRIHIHHCVAGILAALIGVSKQSSSRHNSKAVHLFAVFNCSIGFYQGRRRKSRRLIRIIRRWKWKKKTKPTSRMKMKETINTLINIIALIYLFLMLFVSLVGFCKIKKNKIKETKKYTQSTNTIGGHSFIIGLVRHEYDWPDIEVVNVCSRALVFVPMVELTIRFTIFFLFLSFTLLFVLIFSVC